MKALEGKIVLKGEEGKEGGRVLRVEWARGDGEEEERGEKEKKAGPAAGAAAAPAGGGREGAKDGINNKVT
eukprot:evm.model.NODE_38670_length_1098_cov_9.564663.1